MQKYLLNADYVPGTALGPGYIAVKNTDEILALLELTSSRSNKLKNSIRTFH